MPEVSPRPGRATLAAMGLTAAALALGLLSFAPRTVPAAGAASAAPLVVKRPTLWPDFHYRLRHRSEQPLLLQVAAAEHSWVRLEVDGEPVYEGTLTPGAVRTWQARSTLTAHLGNPRGLRVAVQGEALPLDWEGPIHVRIDG